MHVKLSENFRAVFYAPFYATHALGFYSSEGVDVELLNSPAPAAAAKGLLDGSIDISWGGPMRVMKARDEDPASPMVCFCEVASRDPFFLVGKGDPAAFRLADLSGRKLGIVSEVPTPWLCLQHDLRLAGIDPASIDRVADQTMARNVEALKAGVVDVIQVFEPFPSLLLADKAAHVWYAAASRGPTSYTTFYTRRGTLAGRRDELAGMVRAIAATEKWVAGASGREIASGIASYFKDVPPAILEAACTRYKALGIWNATPILPREGYDRLRDSLVSGGFVSPGTPFETAVDNSLVDA
jgi:NitT/TauT family transport system substrate-binding protein